MDKIKKQSNTNQDHILLNRGDLKVITDRFGVSYYTVRRTLRGTSASTPLCEAIRREALRMRENFMKQYEK